MSTSDIIWKSIRRGKKVDSKVLGTAIMNLISNFKTSTKISFKTSSFGDFLVWLHVNRKYESESENRKKIIRELLSAAGVGKLLDLVKSYHLSSKKVPNTMQKKRKKKKPTGSADESESSSSVHSASTSRESSREGERMKNRHHQEMSMGIVDFDSFPESEASPENKFAKQSSTKPKPLDSKFKLKTSSRKSQECKAPRIKEKSKQRKSTPIAFFGKLEKSSVNDKRPQNALSGLEEKDEDADSDDLSELSILSNLPNGTVDCAGTSSFEGQKSMGTVKFHSTFSNSLQEEYTRRYSQGDADSVPRTPTSECDKSSEGKEKNKIPQSSLRERLRKASEKASKSLSKSHSPRNLKAIVVNKKKSKTEPQNVKKVLRKETKQEGEAKSCDANITPSVQNILNMLENDVKKPKKKQLKKRKKKAPAPASPSKVHARQLTGIQFKARRIRDLRTMFE